LQDELIAELLANSARALSAARVRRELAGIVAQGHYMAPSDTTTGVTDFCAPIFDHSAGAVAALTIPFLKQRDVAVPMAAVRQALLACTARISAGLGATAPR
ncbi:MAG: IclR family transcriptional regulator C-terminal domain-containing protein, partial [Caldimonas sp.]